MKYGEFLDAAMKADAFKGLEKAFVDYIGLKAIILKIEEGGLSTSEEAALHEKFKDSLTKDIKCVDNITQHLLRKLHDEMRILQIPVDDDGLSAEVIGEPCCAVEMEAVDISLSNADSSSEPPLAMLYKKANLIQQYCELNYEGARKIAKKYDKRGGGDGEQVRVLSELQSCAFGQKKLAMSLKAIEQNYAAKTNSPTKVAHVKLQDGNFDVANSAKNDFQLVANFTDLFKTMLAEWKTMELIHSYQPLGQKLVTKPEKPGLYATILGDKPAPVRWVFNAIFVCGLLYLFLLGLDLMGNAFKAMSGKGVGSMLGGIDNPIAGVAIGIIATVLLQSSSTSTSIVVTMVGADILNVTNAIPIIMGANIGTSVTAAIVSHGHIACVEEFHRGFAGANVHGAFNLLTVILLLPIELITQGISGSNGFLGMTSEKLADLFVGSSAETFTSPVKVLVGPLSKQFIKVDKDLIKAIAKGCLSCNATHVEPSFCKDEFKDKDGEKVKMCVTGPEWTQKYEVDGRIIKAGFAKDIGDEGGAAIILAISLIFLCIALYAIVKLLHHLVMSSGRAEAGGETETKFVTITRKVLRFNGYVSMFFGMIMTIAVQSSSIVTSALTPIVAMGIISVEDMLPLTLGTNIGTTCTAFLASIVTEKKSAIQISLCHLLFNVIGILVFYSVPFMRKIPIKMAWTVGDHVLKFKWFGPFYICFVFIAVPLLLFLCSLALNLGIAGILINVVFDTAIVVGSFVLMAKFDRAMAVLARYTNLPFLEPRELSSPV